MPSISKHGRIIDPGPGQSWTMRILVQGDPPGRHLMVTDTATKEAIICKPIPASEFGVAATSDRVLKMFNPPAEILTDGDLSFIVKGFRYPLAQAGIRHFVVRDQRPEDGPAPRACRDFE